MATLNLTSQNIEATLKKDGIVLLDFWASWCGPCRMFGPVFEKASEKHVDVVFGKIDTENEQDLGAEFQIRSIPTLMAFRNGVLLFSQAGALPEKALDELIGKIKELDMQKVKEEIVKNSQKGESNEYATN